VARIFVVVLYCLWMILFQHTANIPFAFLHRRPVYECYYQRRKGGKEYLKEFFVPWSGSSLVPMIHRTITLFYICIVGKKTKVQ